LGRSRTNRKTRLTPHRQETLARRGQQVRCGQV
jgi:hypothetical protein